MVRRTRGLTTVADVVSWLPLVIVPVACGIALFRTEAVARILAPEMDPNVRTTVVRIVGAVGLVLCLVATVLLWGG